MPKALPASPSIEWLKKAAKQRLKSLRARDPAARLHQAQLMVARDHGFASWRALKARFDAGDPGQAERARVFRAARAGDVETVRRAFAAGFDPGAADADGRTIHQIAKECRFEALELLARDARGRETRPPEIVQAIDGILEAAWNGEIENLGQRLDAHPELIDAFGGGFHKQAALHRAAGRSQHGSIRLLLERGADVNRRDFPDNAYPLHVAAAVADLETVKLLVEAGADVIGEGDDYAVGVLGWAEFFGRDDFARLIRDRGGLA